MSTSAPMSAIRLHFRGSYHLGRRRDELAQGFAVPTSDSLKGALAASWVRLRPGGVAPGEVLDFLRSFRISSAYPYHTDAEGRHHYALPVPVGAWPPPGHVDAKRLRKLSHLPQDLFAGYFVHGAHAPQDADLADRALGADQHGRHALSTRLVSARPWAGRPDALPFVTERRSFDTDSGLYFLLSCPDPARRAQVLAALDLLGDSGLGSAKTVGGGHFAADPPEEWHCPAPTPAQARAYMALGRFLPARGFQSDLPAQVLSYRLCSGGGFSAGGAGALHRQLRREAWLLGEGSVFAEDPSAHGTVLDLAPADAPHPVYRDGACLFLPILRPAFTDTPATRP